jgi:hypothetical protein
MAISPDDYRESLRRFAGRAPELLSRHGETAALAIEVARLDLGARLDRRQFRVAVIGRMKSGKSTLQNALLGRRLAPVGVSETTATVNWFDHGVGEQEKIFEIHWKDRERPRELRPLAAINNLTGASEEAKEIDYIRFYVDSAFLKGVTLIDTPGTMSSHDAHQAATIDFLTRKYGEQADATILVLPTVATGADRQLLANYAEQTRLPGQGAYNTIAVLQKWETLDDDEPEKKAIELAAHFRKRLDGHVSEVLPVSGLLGIMAQTVPVDLLDRLAFLGTKTDYRTVEYIFGHEDRFSEERSDAALNAAERIELFAKIKGILLGDIAGEAAGTYEMVKFAVGLAHRQSLSNGEKLQAALWDHSNLDRLQEILDRRFFAISGLIQSGAVLKKVLDPCRMALFSLRDALSRRRALLEQGEQLRAAMGSNSAGSTIEAFQSYLDVSLSLIGDQVKPIDATLRELDGMVADTDRDFGLLLSDIRCLDDLGTSNMSLPPPQVIQARRLFGQFGMERYARLGLDADASVEEQIATAQNLHMIFAGLRWGNRPAQHAEERLSQILNELES